MQTQLNESQANQSAKYKVGSGQTARSVGQTDENGEEVPFLLAPQATPNTDAFGNPPSTPAVEQQLPDHILRRQAELETELKGNVQFKTQGNLGASAYKPFELEPAPIMSLYNRQGLDGANTDKQVCFGSDNSAVASSHKNIMSINVVNGHQRFLIGHERPVTAFTMVPDENLLVSVESDAKGSEFIIWRVVPADDTPTALIMIDCPSQPKHFYLLAVGRDNLDRDLIMIHDISDYQNNQVSLYTKQISDFPIRKIRYVDKENPTLMASCGKENVCFWNLKNKLVEIKGFLNNNNKFITIQPLNLNEHAKNTMFTSIDVLKQKLLVSAPKNEGLGKGAVIPTTVAKSCYFVYVVSSQGFLYLIDYTKGELKSVLKLHQAGINAIQISHNHNFIVTGGTDSFVKIWSIDTSELLYDFKLDSQITSLAVNSADLILLSTMNGSAGTIDIQNKMYKCLVRSHSDKVLGLQYNKPKRLVASVSADRTIRLWDSRNKMAQTYEFQCLDAQPTYLASYQLNPFIVVGFKGGLVRIFDIQNNIFVQELTEPQADVVKIAISHDDQFIVVADASGTLNIYDGQGNYRKTILVEFEPENLVLDLDYYCQSMICSRNPFSIFLFSTSSWEIKQKLTSAEQILTAKFSYLKDKVIVLTTQGKLRFYLLSFYEAIFLKDFGCLHDGGVRDFEVSLNCAYIFTIGLLDNSIKVWDYNFRGNLVPSYQCFSLNEPVSLLTISNDENPWVFTAFENTLNTWMFKGSFEDMKLKNHAEEIAAREKSLLEVQKNSPIVMQNAPSLTSKPDNLTTDQRITTKPLQSGADGRHFVGEEVPGDLNTQELVKKLERLQAEAHSNLKTNPNSTIRTKEVRFQDEFTSLGKNDQMDQEFVELEKALLKNNANFKAGTDNLSEIERVTGERQTNLSVMQDFDKYKHDCLGIEQIFGTQTMLPSSIRWDVTNDYYLVSSSNKIVANYT